jgi:hypothetical protein
LRDLFVHFGLNGLDKVSHFRSSLIPVWFVKRDCGV